MEAVALHAAITTHADPVIPTVMVDQPHVIAPEQAARRAGLDAAMCRVRSRRGSVSQIESVLEWWPAFASSSLAHARRRSARRARAAIAAGRARAALPALTAAQRTERDRVAKCKLEEEVAARAALLRRRAIEKTRLCAETRARKAPAVAVRLVAQEAACQPSAAGSSAEGRASASGGDAEGISPRSDSEVLGKRSERPEVGARDARATAYARHIL